MDDPPKVLSKKPFLPSGSDREPVRPLDLHLRTDLRSEERRQYEQRRKDKEAGMEGARQQVRIVKTQLHRVSYFLPIDHRVEVLHPRRGAQYVNLRCYSVDPM
jgi:hypothetical protein